MKTPSNNILILGAICLSVVAGIAAYKIGEARKNLVAKNQANRAVYVDIQKTNAEAAILESALAKINQDLALGVGTSTNPFAPSPDDTLTDSLAKKVFVSYAEAESSGSQSNPDEIAASIVANMNVSDLPKPTFNVGDVLLFVPKTKDEVRTYGNLSGNVVLTNYSAIANSQTQSHDLAYIAKIHTKIGEELMKIKVPASISQHHLNIANGYSMLGQSFSIIASQEKKDPLKALLAVRTANEAAKNMNSSLEKIQTYFEQNDILYDNTEAGSIWYRLNVQ